jgi:hypothetical protein
VGLVEVFQDDGDVHVDDNHEVDDDKRDKVDDGDKGEAAVPVRQVLEVEGLYTGKYVRGGSLISEDAHGAGGIRKRVHPLKKRKESGTKKNDENVVKYVRTGGRTKPRFVRERRNSSTSKR